MEWLKTGIYDNVIFLQGFAGLLLNIVFLISHQLHFLRIKFKINNVFLSEFEVRCNFVYVNLYGSALLVMFLTRKTLTYMFLTRKTALSA